MNREEQMRNVLDRRHAAFLGMLAGDEGKKNAFRDANREYFALKHPVSPRNRQHPARKPRRKGKVAQKQATLF